MQKPSLRGAIGRGLGRRCPVCDHRGIFRSWGELTDACPNCGYAFVREEGYWVGALIINLAVAMGAFFVLFVGTILLTVPEIPWVPLLVIALVTMGLLPIVFYPSSKTLWMALDLYFHPSPSPPSLPAGTEAR